MQDDFHDATRDRGRDLTLREAMSKIMEQLGELAAKTALLLGDEVPKQNAPSKGTPAGPIGELHHLMLEAREALARCITRIDRLNERL